jgi:hypothetical protein
MSDIFDPREFLRGLDLAEQRYKEAVHDALGQLGIDVMRAAIFEDPSVPLEFGTLRASGSAIVVDADGREELVGTTEGMVTIEPGGKAGTPAESLDDAGLIEAGSAGVVIGYNQPYAARLHEHPEYQFREPGSGAKYLESKIVPRYEDLMARLAARIKARVDGGP